MTGKERKISDFARYACAFQKGKRSLDAAAATGAAPPAASAAAAGLSEIPAHLASFFHHGSSMPKTMRPFDTDLALRRFLAAHAEEVRVLETLLHASGDDEKRRVAAWQDGIDDPKAFFTGLKRLREAPFTPELFGEKPALVFGVRRFVDEKLRVGAEPGARGMSLEFACWCIWLSYKTRIYLHSDIIKAFCSKWSIDLHDMIDYVVPHPTTRGIFTSPKMRSDVAAIVSYFCNAEVHAQGRLEALTASASTLDDLQRQVLASCLTTPVSVVVGGAGVGKTTLLAQMVATLSAPLAQERPIQVVCMAFTHKARRCLQSKFVPGGAASASAAVSVCTIHSYVSSLRRILADLLSTAAGQPTAASAATKTARAAQAAHQMQEHFFIIDEASMVDLELMAELADAINTCKALLPKFKFQLCIVGDDGQLPPIDRGELFRELCEGAPVDGKVMQRHRLEKCYRTSSVDLFNACNALRAGALTMQSLLDSWQVLVVDTEEGIDTALDRIIEERSTCDLAAGTQYIAWQNKDVRRINTSVQQQMLTEGVVGPAFWRIGYQLFYLGDRVVYGGENQADTNLSNAMTGTVVRILASAGGRAGSSVGVVVKWDSDDVSESAVRSNSSILRDIYLAYCMTVHKSQGSEYDVVVVPCYEAQKMMRCLDRRWLYTAATRAKTKAIIICTRDVEEFIKKPLAPTPTSAINHLLSHLNSEPLMK